MRAPNARLLRAVDPNIHRLSEGPVLVTVTDETDSTAFDVCVKEDYVFGDVFGAVRSWGENESPLYFDASRRAPCLARPGFIHVVARKKV